MAADATLLTHDGSGHQIKVNKASATDTASLLFQTGFSGRAEMGLAGNDDFSVKVSADGAAWTEALAAAGGERYAALFKHLLDAGIYIPPDTEGVDACWLGMGIRIEDDVAVTRDEPRILTDGLAKTADDIEALMAA